MNATQQPNRESFAFLWTFKDAMSDLEDEEKLELYEAITDFAFFDVEPVFNSRVARAVFKSIRINLQRAKDRYDRCKRNGSKGAEYGKLGGRPKKKTEQLETPRITPRITPNETPTKPLNVNVNVNDNDNDNDNGNRVSKRSPRFVAPSLDEVKVFFLQSNYSSDAERFFDYYDANGWTQGKGKPIKNWQAAARNWERRQSEFEPSKRISAQPTIVQSQPLTASDYEEDDEAFHSKNR